MLALLGICSLGVVTSAHSAEIIPITSFDPNTFFDGGVTAGLDFNDGTSSNYPDPNQPGFLDVPASNNKVYNLVTGGITFDITVSHANLGNQNRNRNNVNAGRLVNDFEQWFGNTGTAVEAAFALTGLLANTDYEVSFFTYNVGAGQTTHLFYEGTSSAAPLITTFTTSGNQNNYSTWSPGITFKINSGASARIDVTIQVRSNATNNESRISFPGMTVKSLAPPPAEDFGLVITPNATPGLYDFSWDSQDGKVYDLVSATDLASAAHLAGVAGPDRPGRDPAPQHARRRPGRRRPAASSR